MKYSGLLLAAAVLMTACGGGFTRQTTVLDEGWKFSREDDSTAIEPKFADAEWETVEVPHDWAIAGPFDINIDAQQVMVIEDGERVPGLRTGRSGALPWPGVGVYRKTLELPAGVRGKRVYIEFDGAMSNARIYFNGQFVGEHPYGYTSFGVDVTEFARPGKNLLYVRLENRPESSRWYPGAGLYRNVRLVVTEQVHVAQWGTYITTPTVFKEHATVNVATQVLNFEKEKEITLKTTVRDSEGNTVASGESKATFSGDNTFEESFEIQNPELWYLDSPSLYTAVSEVYAGSELLDTYTSTFGIRSIMFDAEKGFFLNGEHIKLYGVCNHHDLGPLGAAVNYRATQRQVEMLKSMGANAIRTSHNPASPELIDICNRMGMLVIEEAFDEWKNGKNRNGYGLIYDEWAEKDLQSMIRRDRNAPCVIMWSIGNEIREQRQSDGATYSKFLADICRREDPTRPVTAGFDGHRQAIANGLAATIDVVGYNYKPHDYSWTKENYPQIVLYGSETASTVSSRGNYDFPLVDGEKKTITHINHQSNSYDNESTSWATLPDTEFAAQEDNPFVLGEFVWTGFDYLGEPTPYNDNAPSRSSYFGIIDLAGLPKDRFYLYKSHWSDEPVLHLLPHWNWEGREGEITPVMCYTNYPKAELFVNGRSQGVREKDASGKYTRFRLLWDKVVYEPGEIKVVAYDQAGQKAAETSIRTAGGPLNIRLEADRTTIDAGGKDLSFVTVKVVDADGNLCPTAMNDIRFSVEGEGSLAALCNGDPTSLVSFASPQMAAFNGMLVAVVKAGKKPGTVKLTATSDEIDYAEIILTVR